MADAWWDLLPINESFLISAAQHTAAAYSVSESEEERAASFAAARAALHAGAAVELLSKSLLAKEHLALIMEKPGDAIPAKTTPLQLSKTADAGVLQRLLCQHLSLDSRVSVLGASILSERNNAAHVGITGKTLSEIVDRLGLWIHFVQEAAQLQGTEWLPPEISAKQERRFNAFAYGLHQKMSKARGVFTARKLARERKSGDFEEWATQLEAELAASAPEEVGPDFDEAEKCPACGRKGRLWGVIDDVEYEYEGPGEYSQNVVWSAYFQCPVCELGLDDDEYTAVSNPGWSEIRTRFNLLEST